MYPRIFCCIGKIFTRKVQLTIIKNQGMIKEVLLLNLCMNKSLFGRFRRQLQWQKLVLSVWEIWQERS